MVQHAGAGVMPGGRQVDGDAEMVPTVIPADHGAGRSPPVVRVECRTPLQAAPRGWRIAEVLAEWRRAERALLEADPLGDEAPRLAAEIERLREQYGQLFRCSFDGDR